MTNLAELAKAAGKSVGLVTTSQVTDASPAAFAAHVDDRDKQSEIAKQYITDTKVDVILGGGEDRWLPAGIGGRLSRIIPPEDTEEASESDQGDLIAAAQSDRLSIHQRCRRSAIGNRAAAARALRQRGDVPAAPRGRGRHLRSGG